MFIKYHFNLDNTLLLVNAMGAFKVGTIQTSFLLPAMWTRDYTFSLFKDKYGDRKSFPMFYSIEHVF